MVGDFPHQPPLGIDLGRLIHERAGKVGLVEVGPQQVGAVQHGVTQVGAAEIGATQYRLGKDGALQVGPGQLRPAQIGPGQVGFLQVGLLQVGVAQIGPGQVEATQVGLAHVGSLGVLSGRQPLAQGQRLRANAVFGDGRGGHDRGDHRRRFGRGVLLHQALPCFLLLLLLFLQGPLEGTHLFFVEIFLGLELVFELALGRPAYGRRNRPGHEGRREQGDTAANEGE